jgi:hypothetical protein
MGEKLMAYKRYTVKQGDCISSIAFKYGFFPDTIWNDSKNSDLKQRRNDPNVLFPGDEVWIREKEHKEESCATEKRHRFKRKGVPEFLIVQLKIDDEPIANEPYVLEIDGALSEGRTDGDGKVEITIPPNANKGKITLRESGDEYELELGCLDPITEISGVQARLRNLGFECGPIDGKLGSKTQSALREFQKHNKLDATGDLDDETRQKLKESHGF